MPPAQFYHWYDVNLRMRMLGIETKKVAKMNEEAAVALGADILGESRKWTIVFEMKSLMNHSLAVILAVAVAGLALEYARRAKNDSDKEIRQQERLVNMEKQLSDLEISLTNQSAQMRQLERLLQHHVSPPSKPSKSSTSNSSVPLPGKQQLVNAFSMLDPASSMQSSLIQLPTIDSVLYPVLSTLQQTNDYIISSIKQWSTLRRTKH